MIFLSDVIAQNMSDKINKDVTDRKNNGFMVISDDETMTISSRIHPWAKNSLQRRKRAIKNLQKEIGGEYLVNVFDDPELTFDISCVESARCNRNQSIFTFKEYIEVHCHMDDDGTVVVPVELKKLFKSEFPSVQIRTEENEWEFIDFDGGYPSLCNGDTILKSGSTIIKTKIISNDGFKWSIEIPKALKEVKLPSSIFECDGDTFHCCGGCE